MDTVLKHFPDITPKQHDQFSALGPLYSDWNSKINVISRKDIDNLYNHHVLHSLSIAKYTNFMPDDTVIDIGTGGGFPGLPLAILFPETSFTLLDSTQKKLKVIDAIAAELGLRNIVTVHARAEETSGAYDYAVSRAVTRLNVIWDWALPLLKRPDGDDVPGGLFYLKGGDISEEIPNNAIVQQIVLTRLIDEPFFTDKALVHIYKKYK